MIPEALAKSTPAGFLLVTNDAAEDELAGPFQTYADLESAAKDMQMEFLPLVESKSKVLKIRDLKSGALFRIDDCWYRLTGLISGEATLNVVGQKRVTTMKWNTEVTQLSVLAMS